MLRELNPPEASRTYLWPDGQTIKILNVTHISVSPLSQNHRLKTADGHLHIVAPEWRHIEIEAQDFTF